MRMLISITAFVACFLSLAACSGMWIYTAEDFGIDTIYSCIDFNGNGIDDYTDILLGARKDAENHLWIVMGGATPTVWRGRINRLAY